MTFSVDFAACTDVGLVRTRNEDSGYAGPHLLAVADGMGGHAGGNVASSIVVARLAPLDGDSHGSDDALQILATTIGKANDSLAEAMDADADLAGMGTTLTALMRAGATGLALVHIGDSRAYLLRDGRLSQITKDHSFVQSLVDSGRITDAEAEHHPQRSLVTRVLTGAADDEPDLSMREARIGDRYVICSDGLSDYVAYDTITEIVTAGHTPVDVADRLVQLALRSGAPDNVTCVVADLVVADAQPSSHPVIVGAAADNTSQGTSAVPASPATKAAALRREATGTKDPEGTNGTDGTEQVLLAEEEDSPRRRWIRLVLLPLIVVVALVGAGWAAYDWSQRQVYIGEAGGNVAIFRGIHQALGPWQLSSVLEETRLPVSELPEEVERDVRTSYTRPTVEEARLEVQRLQRQALCAGPGATPALCPPTPASTPGSSASTGTASSPGSSARPPAAVSPTPSPTRAATPFSAPSASTAGGR
ncbi:MAG TPA: PP2C family serine/threonine-protein phosphatase [Dermatophilaceae bacterium]|nr:PP2C family serine/threonine-protein phosphatase [Dermatophilaceae bacterium]